jgi:hypothetical protein
MMLALLAVLTAPTAPALASIQAGEPPIRLSLNSGGSYERGDRAKVRLRLAEDGYVIVLRADADGRVRVLFPLDPLDDNFVRGGREYELEGRGGRQTFFVDDRTGAGTVLAARSTDPFHFDRFTRGDHWDYRILTGERMGDDPEAGLLDLVSAMADSAHFDYDVVGYSVDGAERYTYRHYGYYRPGYHFGIGFYYGARYRCGYYDLYDPYYCDSYFYDPIYYGYYRPYGYSCYADPFCYSYGYGYGYGRGYWYDRPYVYRRAGAVGGFSFKRPVPPPPLVLPRQRFPTTPIGRGERAPLVTTGRESERRPDFAPRRRETPPATTARAPERRPDIAPRTRETRPEASRPRASGGDRPSGRVTPRSAPPRSATPRSSSPPRSTASKPSNSGTRRH